MRDVVLKDGEDWTVTCKAWASCLVASCCQMGLGYELANEHGAREFARRCQLTLKASLAPAQLPATMALGLRARQLAARKAPSADVKQAVAPCQRRPAKPRSVPRRPKRDLGKALDKP